MLKEDGLAVGCFLEVRFLEAACINSWGENCSCGMISPAAFTFCKSISWSNEVVDKNRLTAADHKNSEEDHCAVNLYFHHI